MRRAGPPTRTAVLGGSPGWEADGVDAPADSADAAPAVHYRERLRVPLWWHPLGIAVAVLLGAELAPALLRYPAAALGAVVGCVVLVEVSLWRVGWGLVEIADGRLRAGELRLPVSAVSAVAVLEPAAPRRPEAAGCYRFQRGWIGATLRVEVRDDPGEPPVWLISTRRPAALLAALVAAREAAVPGERARPAGPERERERERED